jgi:predicted permease
MNWLRRLVEKKRLEMQLQTELQDHLERQAADYLRDGLSEAEALRHARLKFGGVEGVKEDCRDARRTRWVESTLQDARFAARTLRKSPGFALAAIATLALGIGANTAIFSVINGVILRALPYTDPERLVAVEERLRTGENFAFSYPDFLDVQRASRSFVGIAAYRWSGVNVTSPGEPAYIHSQQVSAGFLSVLGIKPFLGREFRQQEDQRNAAPVAMIGYALWQERFGARPKAIGATLVAGGKGYTVVGVLPANFRFNGDSQMLTPIGQNDTVATQKRDMYSGIEAVARLNPGVTLERANSELKAIGSRLAREYPDTNSRMTFGAEPLKRQVIGDIGPTLFLLAGAVGLVLLIACANVANLFLARSLSRTREFSIRAALGAGRGRMLRQLLTESILLGLIGGVGGVLLATAGTGWALHHLPDWLPRTQDIVVDSRVLLFAVAISMITGIVFGLVPALRQRFDLETGLRQGSRGTSRGVRRLQSSFVVTELALALVLLTGSGLMMRTILRLWSVNPGFDPHNLLTMTVTLSPKVLNSPAQMRTGWEQVLERVRNTPGVQAAALDSLLPLSGSTQSVAYWASAETTVPKSAPTAWAYSPTTGYLETMKVPLLRGRFFTEQDRLGSQPVVVIDETLAKRVFPGKDPVGSSLSIQLLGRVRIVGVAGAIKHLSLDEDAFGPRQPALYVPFLQFPDEFMPLTINGMNLLVRTSSSPLSIVNAVKRSVLGPTRDQPVRDVATMEQIMSDSMARRRGMLFLLAIFAGLALALASIGIYSVISYATSRRVQEVGVRMALGARPQQVLRLFMKQGLRMVLIGVVAGIAASFALMRLLVKLLYGVSPADPITFSAVALLLCVIACAAIYVPARRAAQVDPMIALRYE